MNVHCRTNLDLWNEEWPTMLSALPHVGDQICSKTIHKNTTKEGSEFQLKLEVVRITWIPDSSGFWRPEIELHMTDFHKTLSLMDEKFPTYERGSIRAFYNWYAPLVGKSVSYFI